jgi:cell division transport system permease protein
MKRKFVTFSRILSTGAINFVRNAWLAIAAMAVMVITLTIILFSIIANATFTNTIQQITAKIDVSAFLHDGATQTDIDAFIRKVEALPNVKSSVYVSKDEALAKYVRDNAENPELLSAISQTDNPLPATIQIKPKDLNRLEEIRSFLDNAESKKIVADVSYKDDRKEAIDKISHATDLLQKAGIVAVAIFALISVLIIFNTIQMAIFNRRDELTIMRLLGASTSYIRGPFVVESIIYGILSALLSTLLIHMLFVASSSALQASSLGLLDINYSATYFRGHFWMLLTMQLGVGILIGAVSSIVATRRYLKFKTSK